MGGNPFPATLYLFLLEVLRNTLLSFVLNSVFIVSLVSCSKDSVPEKFPKMEFQTDLDLLSEKTVFNNLSLRIPRSFYAIGDEELTLLKNHLENQPNAIFTTIVLGAFIDSVGSTIIVSEIPDANVLEKLDDEFNDALSAAWGGEKPIRSQFTINDLPVVHYQLFNDRIVNVKIFVLINPVFQLDFIVRRDVYFDYQTSIESLFGTLKPINK